MEKQKTDKEVLQELLKSSSIEFDENNNYIILDEGYVEVIFSYSGELIDIRSRT